MPAKLNKIIITVKKRLKKKNYVASLLLIVLLTALLCTIIVLDRRYVYETPNTEVNTLPSEIQKIYQPPTSSSSATLRVPILLYHYVEYVRDKKDTIRQSLDITPDVFEKQVKTLKDAGYTFMTVSDLADVLDGKTKLPDKPVILTFDDGHWDLYTDVLPIIEKYQVKVTAYIVPGFIGGSDSLSSDQLQKVIQSNLVEIGDHTIHHASLAKRPLALVRYEVNLSKEMLEKRYNIHVVSFAYPYGSFDQQAISVVKDAGFKTAVSTVPGILQNQSNRYFLFRIRPGRRKGVALINLLEQSTYKPY